VRIERVVDNFTGSGIVSAASNRRAFRVTQEPLDLFSPLFRHLRLGRPTAISVRVDFNSTPLNAKSRKL